MKKFFVFGLALMSCLLAVGFVAAQDTLPPLGLPTTDDTATATVSATATETNYDDYLSVETVTPTSDEQEAEDVADTGSEIYVLAAVSLLAGFGIYSIKKYKDIKKFSL
jgi:tryptophan synthase alpha subunit